MPFKKPHGRELPVWQRKINRGLSSLRVKVEHPFRVIKCQFGYRKVRYKGLAKKRPAATDTVRLGKSVSGKETITCDDRIGVSNGSGNRQYEHNTPLYWPQMSISDWIFMEKPVGYQVMHKNVNRPDLP